MKSFGIHSEINYVICCKNKANFYKGVFILYDYSSYFLMKILYIYILLLFLLSCENDIPHLEKIDENYLTEHFNKKDAIDTLINKKEYKFYYVADYPDGKYFGWDATHFYFFQTQKDLFRLEPASRISNGDLEIKLENDSTLVIYSQLINRIYGDFWLIKNKDSLNLFYDPGTFSNTVEHDLKYENGKLKQIANINVDLDSAKLKMLKNNLYYLKNGSIELVDSYDKINLGTLESSDNDFGELKDGVYYFSYPGRKIDYYINLNDYK